MALVGARGVQGRAPEYQRSDNKALLDAALVLLDGGLLLSVVDPVLLVACLINLTAVLTLLTSRHECREAYNSFEIHAVLGPVLEYNFRSENRSNERCRPCWGQVFHKQHLHAQFFMERLLFCDASAK